MSAEFAERFTAVPAELRAAAQWLCWRWEYRNGKLTKPPYNARTGGLGASTDSGTWSTFGEAVDALKLRRFDGIGYALRADSGLAGIDLDHCVDDLTGAIDRWACEIVANINSYTEVSPSRTGLRIFGRATLPGTGHKRELHRLDAERYPRPKAAIEVYDRGRYLTVTGQHVAGTPRVLESRQSEFMDLHERFWAAQPERPTQVATSAGAPVRLDDSELLELAFRASNGANIRGLWGGDTSRYGGDDSAADMALLNHLAFWTDRDAARMERLFSQSRLGERAKWRDRSDYRERSIAKAIANCADGYTPPVPPLILGTNRQGFGCLPALQCARGRRLPPVSRPQGVSLPPLERPAGVMLPPLGHPLGVRP